MVKNRLILTAKDIKKMRLSEIIALTASYNVSLNLAATQALREKIKNEKEKKNQL